MEENKAKLNIGDKVVAITKNGEVAIGALYSIALYMAELNDIKRAYNVIIGGNCVQFKEDDLILIAPYDYVFSINDEENTTFLKDIESKHEVKCYDEEGVILPTTTIMANIMDKNVWDKLTEDEKKDFVRIVGFTREDIVEIINVLFDLKYHNKMMHDKRIAALDQCNYLVKKYQEIKEEIPDGAIHYEFLYHMLKIDDLINSI